MIFITLGSQKFQFNRLLKKIDELIELGVIKEDVFAQVGYSDYAPQNYGYKQFLNREEFGEMQKNAELVITHAGTGAIMGALKNKKKVIAVPRLAKFEEHVDNHQIQIVEQFATMNLIMPCMDCAELGECLQRVKIEEYEEYHSNTERYITELDAFFRSL